MADRRSPRDGVSSEEDTSQENVPPVVDVPDPEGHGDPNDNANVDQLNHALHDMQLNDGTQNQATAAATPAAPTEGAAAGAVPRRSGLFAGFRRPLLQRQHGLIEGNQDPMAGSRDSRRQRGDEVEQVPLPFREAASRVTANAAQRPVRSHSARSRVDVRDFTPRHHSSDRNVNDQHRSRAPALHPTEEALSRFTDLDEILSCNFANCTSDDLQAMLHALNNAEPMENEPFYDAFVKCMKETIIGKLNELEPNNNWLRLLPNNATNNPPHDDLPSSILDADQDHDSNKHFPMHATNAYHDDDEFWTLDEIQYQAKVTDDKINSHAEHNKRLKELKAQLADYTSQLSFREQMLQEPKLSARLKSLARSDMDSFHKKIEALSKKIRNMTHIIDDRTTELTIPRDVPDSGYDLFQIRKLVSKFTNVERILRIIVQQAHAHKLSHYEIKELLRMTLPDAAYDTFHANIDYPLKVIFKLLSDQFIDRSSAFSKINDLSSFKFKPKETIRAGLVRLDTLISETNSLFPPNERVGRRANLKKEVLLACVPKEVRGKIELGKVKALRQGRFYSFDEMLEDCEDQLTSLGLPLNPSNTNVPLQGGTVTVSATSQSRVKRRRTNGKVPQATGTSSSSSSSPSLKRPLQNTYKAATNALGRKVLIRNNNYQQQRQKQTSGQSVQQMSFPPPSQPPQNYGGFSQRGRGRGNGNRQFRGNNRPQYSQGQNPSQLQNAFQGQPPRNQSYRPQYRPQGRRGYYRGRGQPNRNLQRQVSYIWNDQLNTHQIISAPVNPQPNSNYRNQYDNKPHQSATQPPSSIVTEPHIVAPSATQQQKPVNVQVN